MGVDKGGGRQFLGGERNRCAKVPPFKGGGERG